MGYAGKFAGNLGDVASGGMMCTLGGVARIGNGVGFNVGAITLGGGARIGFGAALSADAIDGDGGWVAGMPALKRSASWWMVRIYEFPNERKGDVGRGLSSTFSSILATLVTLSTEEVADMMVMCGKKSAVRMMCSNLVFVL